MDDDLATPLLGRKEQIDEEEGRDEEFYDTEENDGIENEAHQEQDEDAGEEPVPWAGRLQAIFFEPLLPETNRMVLLLGGADILLFLKFVAVTLLGVVSTHLFVRWMHLEHRTGLELKDIWLYEGNLILLDCIVFFAIGRLYKQRIGVDHLAWIGVALLSSLYTSILPKFTFLQHSVTLYEIHCTWPWQLWVFVLGIVFPVCSVVVFWHGRYCLQHGMLRSKLIQVTCTLFLFLVPQAFNPSFEFHHWFAGFLLGMHANFDTWWSRATMSWCWGQYMNGIAVWGRDPPLKCTYAYYISTRQQCAMAEDDLDGEPTPDWRNCSVSLTM